MSDTDGKKPLGLRGGPGQVKQSFSHGRTKSVVVETKRKRVVVPKAGAAKTGGGSPRLGDPSKRPAGISDTEMERRMKALAFAKQNEAAENERRAAEEKSREEERKRKRAEIEAKEREEEARIEALKLKEIEEERAKAEADEAKKRAEATKPAPKAAKAQAEDDPAAAQAIAQKATDQRSRPAPAPRNDRDDANRNNRNKQADDSRRSGKLTLNQALSGGDGKRVRSMASMKRKQDRMRQKAMGNNEPREKVVRDV
jgi:translation initiation factor IF-2